MTVTLKVSENSSNPVQPSKPQFIFKQKFKVPVKSQVGQESEAANQDQFENVEKLFEGIDEDSLFGDF